MERELIKKNCIIQLYEEEAEGTKCLYAGIGYFMRMELWEELHVEDWIELSEDYKQNVAGSKEKAERFFENIINLMNAKIMSMAPIQRGQMLFSRNLIQEKYSNNPSLFVHEMAENFVRENQLISRHENQNKSRSSVNEEVPLQPNDNILIESKQLLEAFKSQLQELDQYKNVNVDFAFSNSISSGSLISSSLTEIISDCLERLVISLKTSLDKLWDLTAKAAQADAYKNISLTPPHSISFDDLTSIYCGFASTLSEVHKLLNHSDYVWMLASDKYSAAVQTLKRITGNFFERNMVFTDHPKYTIALQKVSEKLIDAEMKTETSKGKKGNRPTEKLMKIYDTKKRESIDAKIRILGFSEIEGCKLISQSLTLVREQELASSVETESQSSSIQLSSGTLKPAPTHLPYKGELEFKNLKIQGHMRVSESIYSQMVRLCYTVKIQAFGEDYNLKALSLPFFLSTGALQVMELVGSRMWYLANKTDLFHGDFQMISALHFDKVIDMLENRIKSTCPKRRRGLSYQGRSFMKERIPEIDAQGHVTLHTFIKDKMKTPSDDRGGNAKVEYYQFTFFVWFYAFVKTIEKEYHDLWHDGIIHDLYSYRDSCEFLLGDRYHADAGCVLLRPGLSKIYVPNSSDEIHIRFTSDMKIRSRSKWTVSTAPISPGSLKNTNVYDMILNSVSDNVKAKSICTAYDGILSLDKLKKYNKDKGGCILERYHNSIIEPIQGLNITTANGDEEESKVSVAEEDFDTNKRRRKTARQDSTSSFQGPLSSTSSIEPACSEQYDANSTDTVYCWDSDSSSAQTGNLERQNNGSPIYVKSECATNINMTHNGKWQQFGCNIQVDVSNLKTSSNQSSPPLDQTLLNGYASTSPHENNVMECHYDCLHRGDLHYSPEDRSVSPKYDETSLSAIPTTVQAMETVEIDQEVLISQMFVPPPGWTQRDVFNTIHDSSSY